MNAAEVLTLPRLTVAARYRRRATVAGAALAFTGLVALRLRTMHQGLLYPDGYQYLLMARGIGQHLQPVAHLGHGGDMVAPSTDAAAKPLFPALVALAETAGRSPLEAARLVAGVAAATVAPLVGLLTLRLGATRLAALLSGLLCLFSPVLGFWFGFAGPDALAEALALAAALAFVARRPLLAGVLVGLCVTARPEFSALFLAAALAAAVSPRTRRDAILGSTAALLTLACVVAVLRPPIATSTLLLLCGAAAVSVFGAVALVWADRASARAAWGAVVAVGSLLVYAVVHGGGWSSMAAREWPLIALAGGGLVLATRSPATRPVGLRIVTLAMVLALAYWWKNPGSERYAAMLVPALAVLAGLGLSRIKPAALTGAGVLAVVATLSVSAPAVGADAFPAVAARLERAPAGTIVTAAPDAYSTLLPGRAVRVMRPGVSGLVLVDGAARAYEPDLRVVGTVLERIAPGPGFLRPDGRLDRAPAILYRGTVESVP